MITIKKYPNRRLYDTAHSKYINLDHIKQLVVEGTDFEVVDSKTGEDLTRTILLQIITESESSDQQSLLTNQLLKQLIRFYGSDMQIYLRQYLEQSLMAFLDKQEAMQSMMKNLMDVNPINMFSKLMEQNMEAWNSFNKSDDKKE